MTLTSFAMDKVVGGGWGVWEVTLYL